MKNGSKKKHNFRVFLASHLMHAEIYDKLKDTTRPLYELPFFVLF